MPLPLPDLDDRRWSDLVEEARSLIPRHAPEWTDHNLSDPGITVLELMAWIVESELYRVNRVTDRERRKLLALVGVTPKPPRPATFCLALTSRTGTRRALPVGTVVRCHPPEGDPVPYRLGRPLTLTGLALMAVQVVASSVPGETGAPVDQTQRWQSGQPVPLWGSDPDPASGPALLLGLDAGPALSPGDELTLQLRIDPGAGRVPDGDDEREALARADIDPRLHHGARAVWELFDGNSWVRPSALSDETRSLSLGGAVRIPVPGTWPGVVLGSVPTPLRWLRCRLDGGRPDAAPALLSAAADAGEFTQTLSVTTRFRVVPGVTLPAGVPVPGTSGPTDIRLDGSGRLTHFDQPVTGGVTCQVLEWQAPVGSADGQLVLDLAHHGPADGTPGESFVVLGKVLPEQVELVTSDGAGGSATRWARVPDFDAVARDVRAYSLDMAGLRVTVGDGDRGRTLAFGEHAWLSGDQTLGAAGTVPRAGEWELAADDPHNTAAFGPATDLGLLRADVAARVLAGSVRPGLDAADLDAAEGEALESLWAHERLLEIGAGSPATLDQVPTDVVLGRRPPQRGATLLDLERIALSVPGTTVLRARAFSRLDPAHPCLSATATVTVVVVPALPSGAPTPTPGLLRTVRRHLAARRVLGTRLVVVGPQYVVVSVAVRVQLLQGAIGNRVRRDVLQVLDAFLSPLTGGPAGLGWPFGRDVSRSELMQVVDEVPGVDHVAELTMSALRPGCAVEPVGCGSVDVAPTGLVAPGQHSVEVSP